MGAITPDDVPNPHPVASFSAQIGGVVIQRKRYGPLDYCASALLCLGLVVFTLADISMQASYNTTGVRASR